MSATGGCHYVRQLDGVPRVFAEYVPGGSLLDWITDRRLYADGPEAAAALAVNLAIQIAWGLDHAHARGLVHQDVKPGNVLVDRHDDGAVVDAAHGGDQCLLVLTESHRDPAWCWAEVVFQHGHQASQEVVQCVEVFRG
jgi:serine/threonine protein kinase